MPDLVLAVDLASKLSAAVLVERSSGQIVQEFDSRDVPPFWFLRRVAEVADSSTLVVVEDVPYGISSQAMVKPVLRLQGALMALMSPTSLEQLLFVTPAVWMKRFDGVARAPSGLSKTKGALFRQEKARQHAETLGYHPPDLVQQARDSWGSEKMSRAYRAVLEKSMTDYISAFLISEFSRHYTYSQLLEMPGVSRAMI